MPEVELKLSDILSNNNEYFSILFGLLQLGVQDIATKAWNLLTHIPNNTKIAQSIRTLERDYSSIIKSL
jgi:hypothetical protein